MNVQEIKHSLTHKKLHLTQEEIDADYGLSLFGGSPDSFYRMRDWYSLYWKIRRGIRSFIFDKKRRPTEEDKIRYKEEYGFDLNCGWIVEERNWVKWYRNHINPHFNEYED